MAWCGASFVRSLCSGERGRLRGLERGQDGLRRDRPLGRLGPAASLAPELADKAAQEIAYGYCTRWCRKVRSRRVLPGDEERDAAPGSHERGKGSDLGRIAVREVERHDRPPSAAARLLHESGGLPLQLRLEQGL